MRSNCNMEYYEDSWSVLVSVMCICRLLEKGGTRKGE